MSISESPTSLTGGLKFEANEEIGAKGSKSTVYISSCRKQDISSTTALNLLFNGELTDFTS